MRNSSCEASAIRDWRCMPQAPTPHGSGRSTARGFSGPIRSAPGCSMQPMAQRLPGRFSGRRICTGARWRASQAGSHRTARSGWSGCAASARRSVRSLPAAARGLILPIAALTRDGIFVGASNTAQSLLGFRNLSEVGLDDACSEAVKQGRVETPVGIGHLILQRVGTGADVGLVAMIAPGATQAAVAEPVRQPIAPAADLPIPDDEQSAMPGEAPAEFALIDEFAEWPTEGALEPAGSEQPPALD